MSTDRNKEIYRQYLEEGFNSGNLDALDAFLSPDYVYHEAPPGTPAGPEGIKHVVKMFRTAFPDFHITIEEQVAEGDTVCSRTTSRGTHKGTIFGMPPTGNAIEMTGITWVRITDGKITDSWVRNDVATLMRQLGWVEEKR